MQVDLLSREGAASKDDSQRGQGRVVQSIQKVLLGDGEAVPVKFELPPSELGHRALCLRVNAPPGAADASDRLFMEGALDCSEHRTHVLLVAGGPLRDYQYVRTLLARDKSMEVSVLLQSSEAEVVQDAKYTLHEFPAWRPKKGEDDDRAMDYYDCLVGFDPNWKLLKPDQVDSLFDWVDEDYGGMIVVAGPVYAGHASEGWIDDPDMAKIRRLYPVEFNQGFSALSNAMYGSQEPWPLEFTDEGLHASYLWLGDSDIASRATWSQFRGVYSFCRVRDKKAGATVLARFGDPRTAVDGEKPIYMAVQRYSASPILYLGSAETWRLRAVDPALLEQFWTKTIRFVAQEHLLRQSSRGSLSIDRDRYNVGDVVEVRAQLKNSRLQPLTAPSVTLHVIHNGIDRQELLMPADPSRPGRFVVELPVLDQGPYELTLNVPETTDEQLHQSFRSFVPRLEEEDPQRNAALVAGNCREVGRTESQGRILRRPVGGLEGGTALVDELTNAGRTELIPLAPKPEEDEKWLKWMLVALCCVLSLEWLVRRLAKLA